MNQTRCFLFSETFTVVDFQSRFIFQSRSKQELFFQSPLQLIAIYLQCLKTGLLKAYWTKNNTLNALARGNIARYISYRICESSSHLVCLAAERRKNNRTTTNMTNDVKSTNGCRRTRRKGLSVTEKTLEANCLIFLTSIRPGSCVEVIRTRVLWVGKALSNVKLEAGTSPRSKQKDNSRRFVQLTRQILQKNTIHLGRARQTSSTMSRFYQLPV